MVGIFILSQVFILDYSWHQFLLRLSQEWTPRKNENNIRSLSIDQVIYKIPLLFSVKVEVFKRLGYQICIADFLTCSKNLNVWKLRGKNEYSSKTLSESLWVQNPPFSKSLGAAAPTLNR